MVLIVAGMPFGLVYAVKPMSAVAAEPGAVQAAAEQRLSRDDVDLLLRQARTAIGQGKLDEADALVRRAEASRIHYSLFHLGPTPSSVRRELNRARRGQPSATGAASSAPRAMDSGTPADGATSDPFLARQQAAAQLAPAQPPGLTAAPRSLPVPAGMPSSEFGGVVQASAETSQPVAPAGQNIVNPFVAPRGSTQRPAATYGYDFPAAGYPTMRAGWDQEAAAAASPDAGEGPNLGPASGDRAAWALPDAPLPRGMNLPQSGPGAMSGLMPPERTVAESAPGAPQPSAASLKQQALSHLSAARTALESGNIDLAEKLARAANELGVPESQFLPDEDRPSLLAWDIERVRRESGASDPLPAIDQATRLPAASPTSGAQLRQPMSEGDSMLAQAQGETAFPTLPQDESLDASPAALPEPLELPSEPRVAVEPRALPTNPSIASTLGQPPVDVDPVGSNSNDATSLLEAGEAALARHDRQGALHLFAQAHAVRGELNQQDQQRLQDRLQMLAAEPVDTTVTPAELAPPTQPPGETLTTNGAADAISPNAAPVVPPPADSSLLESTDEAQQVAARQLSAEIGRRQSEAKRLRETDVERALATLREAQQMVEQSNISQTARRELLGRIKITLAETEKFVDDNKAEIDLDAQNEAVLNEVERERDVKLKVQQKTAELVDEFNRLKDEQRYAEAEIIAKRLIEMSPDDPVAKQVYQTAKFIRREMMNRDLADLREESNWNVWNDVEESAISPVGDENPLVFDQRRWSDFVLNRKGSRERMQRRTERELEIERRLKTPVMLRYQETPLSQVIEDLSELTGVNIHLDPRGLNQEGYNSDTPVTVHLTKEVSLKSALNLILEPLHLSYVIKDEVLKITSEQLRDGEIYAVTYNVADLVIPIPNFVPNNNIGLQGLIQDAHAAMGYGANGVGVPGPAVLVNGRPQQGASSANDQVLAQQIGAVPGAGTGAPTSAVPIGAGPGGMGAGANADFDSLIDLIISTVSTDTWAENGGGEAEIRPFPTNLSLVISQTQAVHEEIADLLEQLRRLQDLQVTIEVRFIRLSDRFFERIGIDFDMNIEDRTIGTADLVPGFPFEPGRQSATVGLNPPVLPTNPFPNYTADLDIPFRQGNFNVAIPPVFGGFDPTSAATFGFAILSDIEAFFLIEAAQGDARTNILNAPKVTLFNGQQAFVADTVQQPFVIGVIPVVGEFVAAQQPVIVVLNEGTMMTIQAVVSDDRRYVRLTVVPFFTEVGDVQEFTFEGRESSTSSSSSSTDDDDDGKNETEEESEEQVNRSGVTVQLPAFQFVSVVTTVSVPDGGTVLLGGIKRLSEGRNEFGVPLLSKVPYINRLFRNVGIGRDTDSLMMMVTPRIIIQEEEEERLGVPPAP
jgi:general secretion pathway protein D